MTIVTGGLYHSLAAATSDVVSTTGSTTTTAGNNGPRLLEDTFGKLLLVSVSSQGGLTTSWSNDAGATWSSSTVASGSGYATPIWALGPDGTLHLVYKGPSGITYQHLTIPRDANNNVTGVTTAGNPVV